MPRKNHCWIACWLFICCAMVFCMVVVGGITRLTESGLSITEWKPVVGIVPPLSSEEWEVELKKYRTTPEYIIKNSSITLQEFKRIYGMEYAHRLLARLTGFIFLIPFLGFLFSGSFSGLFTIKLLGILVLGGSQAAAGWYMVKSGLVDVPAVSQYLLALHLFIALLIFSLLFWLALEVRSALSKELYIKDNLLLYNNISPCITICIFIQITLGAFLAGLDGGLVYNTFPLMDGELIPGGLFVLRPLWKNLFENVTLIQFLHRIIAVFLIALIAYFWFSAAKAQDKKLRITAHCQILIVFAQFFLGVATLLSNVSIVLASLHQANALVLLAVSLFINHRFYGMKRAGEET